MNLKGYLKPNKSKILISLLLIGISVFAVFVLPLSLLLIELLIGISVFAGFLYYFVPLLFPFYFAMILFYNVPLYFIITIFVLISYPFGCYISQNRKWVKGIILYLVVFILISMGIFFAIRGYNNTVGRYCNTDSDCHLTCGEGSVNNKYISLRDPFVLVDCAVASAICENNKCEIFAATAAASVEDCERATQQYMKTECYYFLAKKLNDTSLCNKIEEQSFKEDCIKQFEE